MKFLNKYMTKTEMFIVVVTLVFVAVMFFSLMSQANAATICSRSGACANVSDQFAGRFSCLVRGLEQHGQRIKFMGGYRNTRIAGTWQMSKHSYGAAIDINQYARNYNRPAMIGGATRIASRCGLVHGAVWRYRDSGHFEIGSHKRRKHRR